MTRQFASSKIRVCDIIRVCIRAAVSANPSAVSFFALCNTVHCGVQAKLTAHFDVSRTVIELFKTIIPAVIIQYAIFNTFRRLSLTE